MKRYITISFALLGLVSISCQKMSSDMDNYGIVKTVASASIIDDSATTKTSLDVSTKKLTWASGDIIYVVAPDTKEMYSFHPFSMTSEPGSASAEFVSDPPFDFTGASYFAAYYGKRSAGYDQKQYRSGNDDYFGLALLPSNLLESSQQFMSFFYPWKQNYSASGPDSRYLLMRSTKESSAALSELEFENLTSIMRIRVSDSRSVKATLSSIKVICDDAPISGQFYGNATNSYADRVKYFKNFSWGNAYGNSKDWSAIPEGGYGNIVIMENINVALTADAQDFYIIVAPGGHGKITVTLTDTATPPTQKTYSISSFTSEKGKIYKFPIIDFGEI